MTRLQDNYINKIVALDLPESNQRVQAIGDYLSEYAHEVALNIANMLDFQASLLVNAEKRRLQKEIAAEIRTWVR